MCYPEKCPSLALRDIGGWLFICDFVPRKTLTKYRRAVCRSLTSPSRYESKQVFDFDFYDLSTPGKGVW